MVCDFLGGGRQSKSDKIRLGEQVIQQKSNIPYFGILARLHCFADTGGSQFSAIPRFKVGFPQKNNNFQKKKSTFENFSLFSFLLRFFWLIMSILPFFYILLLKHQPKQLCERTHFEFQKINKENITKRRKGAKKIIEANISKM